MRRAIVMGMAWLIVTLPSAAAAQRPREKKEASLKEAIAACRAAVRKEGSSYSQFDAYVRADGAILYFGTAKERFSFEKCMDEQGHTLTTKASPSARDTLL